MEEGLCVALQGAWAYRPTGISATFDNRLSVIGGRWSGVGGRRSEVGGRRSEVGGRRSVVARYRRERSQRDGEGMPSRAVTSELGRFYRGSLACCPGGAALPLRGQRSVVGCRWSVVGGRWAVVGCRLSVVGCRLSVVGCRLSVVGGRRTELPNLSLLLKHRINDRKQLRFR